MDSIIGAIEIIIALAAITSFFWIPALYLFLTRKKRAKRAYDQQVRNAAVAMVRGQRDAEIIREAKRRYGL